ncbi:aminoglycoside 3'-phosphotransferase [Phototrophicus methaneseepsis]|uniref:Aminoglycoside 3'-phosphotransferase n=1 Tax=Phototrophicus methaneseepsis TaxID=2710758 RepID=A0A7S8E9F8_9CHLR|nr:APH(3') family aminoglycoside O-phosphotransferase [Phototrophicus methaneseepsis]QPC82684.1 aminoglycoside 3'-phosphotransferase [Phototrophicus methaneseepsis]
MDMLLPPPIALQVTGFTWEKDEMGLSGNAVYLLTKGQTTCYLKTAMPEQAAQLESEAARMRWLGAYLPVPEVIDFAINEQGAYLLMHAVPGKIACDAAFQDRISHVVKALAAGLRQFHAVPIQDCPFDQRREVQIAEARQRMVKQLIDMDDFEPQWQGRSASALYDELLRNRPAGEDLVLTHGDFCLPNMLIDPATMQVSGFVDLGRAGISDRYTDLALTARSLAMNWGKPYVPLLFDAYGIKPDAAKLHFYTLLDEFF